MSRQAATSHTVVRIEAVHPAARIRSLTSAGTVEFPCDVTCGCGQIVRMKQKHLAAAHARATRGEAPLGKTGEAMATKLRECAPELDTLPYDKFVTHIPCPRCDEVTVILWSWNEVSMARSVYAPERLWGVGRCAGEEGGP